MQALLQASQAGHRLVKVDGLHRCFLLESRGPEGQALVLKDLAPGVACDPAVSSKWIQRAVQNTALRHPACSRVLEWGEQEGSGPYFISEYHRGAPLSGVLQAARTAGQTLAPDVGAYVACVLLETLVHAVELDASLTHLDLDPDSVLVRADGSLLVPEFGLWGVLASGDLSKLRFDSGRVRCSSPEVVKSQPADARSDVFSVGAILFELVTGERAFTGATQLVIAMAIAEGARRPVQALAPRAPQELCAVIETMLAISPEARFQSAAAALTALRSALAVDGQAARARLAALVGTAGPSALPPRAELRPGPPDPREPTRERRASVPASRVPAPAPRVSPELQAPFCAPPTPQASFPAPAHAPHGSFAASGPPPAPYASSFSAPAHAPQGSFSAAAPPPAALASFSAPPPVAQASSSVPPLAPDASLSGPLPAPPPLGERQHFSGLSLGGLDAGAPLPPPLVPGFRPGGGASRELSAPSPPALLEAPVEVLPAGAPAASGFSINDGRTSHLKAPIPKPPSLIVAQPKLDLPGVGGSPRASEFPPLPSSIELAARPKRERAGRAKPLAGSAAIVVAAEPARAHVSATPEKWRDPSPTLFHPRARPRRPKLRGRVRMPGAATLLLAMLFGFVAVVAAYLLYRLA